MIIGVISVVVSLAVLAGLILLYRFAKEEIDGLQKALNDIAIALWRVWCMVYTIRWRLQAKARRAIARTVLGTLLMASFWFTVDTTLTVARLALEKSTQESETSASTPNAAQAPPDPQRNSAPVNPSRPPLPLRSRLKIRLQQTSESFKIPHPPSWVELVLFLFTLFVLRHYWHEWKLTEREMELPEKLETLFIECQKGLAAVHNAADRQSIIRQTLLNHLTDILKVQRGRKIAIVVSLMEKGPDEKLRCTDWYPKTEDMDRAFALDPGQGAAGLAFRDRVPIYVPSTKHLVGINLKTFRSTGITYEENARSTFRSLLSVPVIGENDNVLVLNCMSNKANIFYPLDFAIARLAAALLPNRLLTES